MKYKTRLEHDYISVFCARCGHEHKALVPCQDRFCPVCSIRRQIRVRNHLHSLFQIYKRRPKYRLRMITLSFPNPPDLASGVSKLIRDFRRLRQRQFWSSMVEGGIAVIEIKGRPGSWHPHLHIIAYSMYLPWKILKRHWHAVSGGDACWISLIQNDQAIKYVTKYITKLDIPIDVQDEPNKAMKGRHLFLKFGSWQRLKPKIREYLFVCTQCGSSDMIDEYTLSRLKLSG